MELTQLYIPKNVVSKDEHLKTFYAFYEELNLEIPFKGGKSSIKKELLGKAEELNEPALKQYIENIL